MNELTREANRNERMGNLHSLLVPALLGAVTLTGAGNYMAISEGNIQLGYLNESVAETNRLSELRGSMRAEIFALQKELDKVRDILDGKEDSAAVRVEMNSLRTVILALRDTLDRKVDQSLLVEALKGVDDRLNATIAHQKTLVNQKQFETLVGRVDAVSRRTSGAQTP